MTTTPKIEKILSLYESGLYSKVLPKVKTYLNKNRDSSAAWNVLALSYRFLGDTAKSEYVFKQLVLKNPLNVGFRSNLANLYMNQGQTDRAANLYQSALSIAPDDISTLLGLGLCHINSNSLREATQAYEKILAVEPKHQEAGYQLATISRKCGDFARAVELFDNLDGSKSKIHQADCLYCLQDIDRFKASCTELMKKKYMDPLLGSLIQHANIEHDLRLENPFCDNALDYVAHENLLDLGLLDASMVGKLLEFHERKEADYRGQPLLEKGEQTSGNIFTSSESFVPDLERAMMDYVSRYRERYGAADAGFLKKFPKNFKLYGWLIEINSGGFLKPHIHKEGWVSASMYLKVPSVQGNEAGIEFSYHGADYPASPDKFPSTCYNIREGDICMFPSSLFHRTNSFTDDNTRVSFAFDVHPRTNIRESHD